MFHGKHDVAFHKGQESIEEKKKQEEEENNEERLKEEKEEDRIQSDILIRNNLRYTVCRSTTMLYKFGSLI